MKRAALVASSLVAVATLAACGGGGGMPSPTTPTTPTAPASQPRSVQGNITLRTIAPSSGATLPVRECYNSSYNAGFKDLCADLLQMTVDVELANSVSNAVVTARFYRGSQA